MPSQLPLDMLINLAKESTDEAARLLGRLSAERTNAERQLGMLQTTATITWSGCSRP